MPTEPETRLLCTWEHDKSISLYLHDTVIEATLALFILDVEITKS